MGATTMRAASQSHILHARARRHHYAGTGALSVKSFYGGQARYEVGGGHRVVEEATYLVLNEGQPYSITVDAKAPVESFCVFFARGLAEDVHRTLIGSAESLLDDPQGKPRAPVRFFERVHPADDVVSPVLASLRADAATLEAGAREERLRLLMTRLLQAQGRAAFEARSLTALRASTREELYRRLHRARDHAAATYAREVSLDELARVACLSPSHLLRGFKQLFGRTPHQYLTERRLEAARRLLARTDLPVTEVCLAVGFESLGSFSALFRRLVGLPPLAYRRQKGDFGEAPPASRADTSSMLFTEDEP